MSKEKVLPPSPYLIHCSMKPCDKVNENYQSLVSPEFSLNLRVKVSVPGQHSE